MTLKRFATVLPVWSLLAFGVIFNSAQAQLIPLMIDSAQSSVEISIGSNFNSSQLSGDLTFDIQSSTPPSGSAQITDLNLVVDEAISFRFLFGAVSASASPGDVTISMVTPGSAGTISGNSFDQLANLLTIDGELAVSDRFNLAGGDQVFDLSTIVPGPADFNSVSVTQSGNVITISDSISFSETFDFGAGAMLLVVNATYVASGVVPETVLLGDVNRDNAVDFLDLGPFIEILSEGGFQEEADIDGSTVVDFLDLGPFIEILSGQ